ncbi:MAG: DNA polymerase I [Candidatus Latescibacteria bacterium]|nr:DNA polymerase I [Candidatus Latescibacterota bacterium]
MSAAKNKLFLLDGMALVYRGHFALIRNPRMTSGGMNTSAVFVFATNLLNILVDQQATHIAAVFDTPEPTHRHIEYKEYKAQREAMPEDLSAALPFVFRLCEAFNVPVIRVPGWEADDVIGTLALQAEGGQYNTYMVTPDKDYGQLVSDTAFIYKPGGSGDGADIQGVTEIKERWGIERIDQVIDMLGLMGDSSDNIPGVPSIGEKTAQKLIAEFDSVEGVYENLEQIKGKRRQVLEENHEQALLSKRLVTIDREVPLELGVADLAVKPRNDEALKELFTELEFNTFGKRLFGDEFEAKGKIRPGEDIDPDDLDSITDVEHVYHLVETPEARAKLIAELGRQESYCFDLETTGLDTKTCQVLGLAFSFAAHTGYYVVVPEDQQQAKAVLEEFRPLFEKEGSEKIGHHLKYDLSVLLWQGIAVAGPFFDTMLAAHLATPDLRRSMDALAQALLNYKPIPITDLIGEKGSEQLPMREVPLGQLTEYAAEDADITFQLSEKLRPLIVEGNQERIFTDVECPLVPVLVSMEYYGIRVDKEALHVLSKRLGEEIGQTGERIFALAEQRFNLNSPQQMGQVLFDELKLDPNAKRTTKTGQYSTSEQVLRRLAFRHEIVREILTYRAHTKLKSTYVDTLPGSVYGGTGHVHTHYEQAVTATGRMQSSGPNLQNIPIRTDQGREIRRAFLPAGDEFTLLSADYSQIELRLIAELSGDEELLKAFDEGADIHSATAIKIYDVDTDGVTADMRRKAKTVNFGIIYGISAFGLAERLDISRVEAADIIEQYFVEYPGVRRYMDETVEFAQKNGYVETMLGRRRYLRDINSRNATTRKGEERNAINAPIQGTAADMIKLAMSSIHRRMHEEQVKSRMLLQVHDELVFDLHRDEVETLPPLVEAEMKNALQTRVPIVVEMGTGATWLEAH